MQYFYWFSLTSTVFNCIKFFSLYLIFSTLSVYYSFFFFYSLLVAPVTNKVRFKKKFMGFFLYKSVLYKQYAKNKNLPFTVKSFFKTALYLYSQNKLNKFWVFPFSRVRYKITILDTYLKNWLLFDYYKLPMGYLTTPLITIDLFLNLYNKDLWFKQVKFFSLNLINYNWYHIKWSFFSFCQIYNTVYFYKFYWLIFYSLQKTLIKGTKQCVDLVTLDKTPTLNFKQLFTTFNLKCFNGIMSLTFIYFVKLFQNPLFIKLYFITYYSYYTYNLLWANVMTIYTNLKGYYYKPLVTNLWPSLKLLYVIKKYFIKTFKTKLFSNKFISYFSLIIVRFFEYCTGRFVYFKIYPFILKTLTFFEILRCLIWARRLRIFRKLIGPRLFLNESLQIIYLALKFKDPYLLSNWISVIMDKINFWKHRLLFRYLKYVFKTFFFLIFMEVGVRGVRIQLKGKISVAGNARTRKIIFRFGVSTISTTDLRVVYDINLIKTFTGVMGLKIWFFY